MGLLSVLWGKPKPKRRKAKAKVVVPPPGPPLAEYRPPAAIQRSRRRAVVPAATPSSDDDEEETRPIRITPPFNWMFGDDIALARHTDIPGHAIVLFCFTRVQTAAALLTGGEDDIDLVEFFEYAFEELMLSKDRASLKQMERISIAQSQVEEEVGAHLG